jgi:hypothetical protein
LKSIGRYVHRRDTTAQPPPQRSFRGIAADTDTKEKQEAVERVAYVAELEELPKHWKAEDVFAIDWGPVTYVTVRDQLFSPLLQGFVW